MPERAFAEKNLLTYLNHCLIKIIHLCVSSRIPEISQIIFITLHVYIHVCVSFIFNKVIARTFKVMYRCESWTIMKAECQRIDAVELWCWRRFLRVPWTARRSDQFILKPSSSLASFSVRLSSPAVIVLYDYSRNDNTTFIVTTDAEAETPILWPPDMKNLSIGKDPDAGKD